MVHVSEWWEDNHEFELRCNSPLARFLANCSGVRLATPRVPGKAFRRFCPPLMGMEVAGVVAVEDGVVEPAINGEAARALTAKTESVGGADDEKAEAELGVPSGLFSLRAYPSLEDGNADAMDGCLACHLPAFKVVPSPCSGAVWIS